MMFGFHTASPSNVSQDLITAKVDSATHELDDCPISPNWSAHFGFPTGILNQLTLYHEITFKLCLLLQSITLFPISIASDRLAVCFGWVTQLLLAHILICTDQRL